MANYFSKFPKAFYNLSNNKIDVVTNITSRFSFEKSLKENMSSYYVHEIREGDTPEILAYKAYGSAERHWIILSFNDILDPQFDWPFQYDQLNNYIERKYAVIQNVSITNAGSGYSNGYISFETTDKVGSGANAYFTVNTAGSIQTITLLNRGSGYLVQPNVIFNTNGSGAVISTELTPNPIDWARNNVKSYYKVETQTTEDGIETIKKYEISQNTYVNLQNEETSYSLFGKSIYIKISKESKTYYDYEIELNENKRFIKILRPEFVKAVEDELRSLFS